MVLPELEKIRKKRNALGLSQEKLATELTLSGVKLSRVVINRIENRKPKKKKYSPSYDVVKSILQTSVDFGWKKTKTVDELRTKAFMTVRDAREIVKSELESTRRWDNDSEKENRQPT